jgi:hypothetical protein
MPMTRLISGLRAALRSPLMLGWLALCVLLVAASFGVIAWVVWPQRAVNQIFPVHYTIYFGIDRVGPWWQVFLPAYVALGALLINLGVVAAYEEREKLVGRLVAALTLPLLGLLLAAAVFVSLLNVP